LSVMRSISRLNTSGADASEPESLFRGRINKRKTAGFTEQEQQSVEEKLLPTALFRRVYIRFTDRFVVLEPWQTDILRRPESVNCCKIADARFQGNRSWKRDLPCYHQLRLNFRLAAGMGRSHALGPATGSDAAATRDRRVSCRNTLPYSLVRRLSASGR
jgi:hypothetical protein